MKKTSMRTQILRKFTVGRIVLKMENRKKMGRHGIVVTVAIGTSKYKF